MGLVLVIPIIIVVLTNVLLVALININPKKSQSILKTISVANNYLQVFFFLWFFWINYLVLHSSLREYESFFDTTFLVMLCIYPITLGLFFYNAKVTWWILIVIFNVLMIFLYFLILFASGAGSGFGP